jgi:hypothetical protein
MKGLFVLVVLALAFTALVEASSHGEAPGVLANPPSDATDIYAFRSYQAGRSNYVVIQALYNPLQTPQAGPNYFPLSNDYYYDILVDRDGDGIEEILYTFDITSELAADGGLKVPVGPAGSQKQMSVPLKVIGQIDASASDYSGVLNYIDSYTLTVTTGGKTKFVTELTSGNKVFTIPFDNAGKKTIPNYKAYSAKYMYNVNFPSCGTPGRVFVGQRKDPFYIALGQTFDLINYQGDKLPIVGIAGGVTNGKLNNDINRLSVDAFVLEVPISCLVGDKGPVIGVWTRTRSKATGKQNQRMGNALVNELIIGLDDKDKWNKVTPKDDSLFKDYFNYPAFPELLNILFAARAGSSRIAPTNFPRNDLNFALQQGLPGINLLTKSGALCDMIRLNTSVPATPYLTQNPLGVIMGDLAGYPNGRRPGDDVVDITLRVAMGVLCTTPFGPYLSCSAADATTGTFPFGDGASGSARDFPNIFPFLNAPLPGAV